MKILFINILFLSILLPGSSLSAQVFTHDILDLRTRTHMHRNHAWSFRPGDSPLAKNRKKLRSIDGKAESVFLWARPYLKSSEKKKWIPGFDVQLSWTEYVDGRGNKPFGDFELYRHKYKGYGWYRTRFRLSDGAFFKKESKKSMVLRLGKIGQADAVYLNGRFIGGTGLSANTEPEKNIADRKLLYSKIRYYELPAKYLNKKGVNFLAVRVFAKYDIYPGLSRDKFYITEERLTLQSRLWNHARKAFVIVLTLLLGFFYAYWQYLLRDQEGATIFFALSSFTIALNAVASSQFIFPIYENILWLKTIEFITYIIFFHMVVNFVVNFSQVDLPLIRRINRTLNLVGLVFGVLVFSSPDLGRLHQIIFYWGLVPVFVLTYLIYVIARGRRIPAMSAVSFGLTIMLLCFLNDILINLQFRIVTWEVMLKDYGYSVFALSVAASIVKNMVNSRRKVDQHNRERSILERFLAPEVMDEIMNEDVQLGGTERPMAVLFADIVGFTGFSEKRQPAEVINRLNEMFERLSSVIFAYNGTLDKYIGDCVMAFWGAPRTTPYDAYKAVACAMEMQAVIKDMNNLAPKGESAFRLRIGVNYGDCIAGYLGSEKRMDYTVIGDAVNTASRIEAGGTSGRVAVSEAAFAAAGGPDYIKYSSSKIINPKGKKEVLKIFFVKEVLERDGILVTSRAKLAP